MSLSMTAAAGSKLSGKRARFASASLTWKYSAKTPSLKLENFHPASMPPECMEYPACASRLPQSGVMAGTMTRSPGFKVLTRLPTSTISPTASWPKIMSVRSPIAPSQTVWISEVQGRRPGGARWHPEARRREPPFGSNRSYRCLTLQSLSSSWVSPFLYR